MLTVSVERKAPQSTAGAGAAAEEGATTASGAVSADDASVPISGEAEAEKAAEDRKQREEADDPEPQLSVVRLERPSGRYARGACCCLF